MAALAGAFLAGTFLAGALADVFVAFFVLLATGALLAGVM